VPERLLGDERHPRPAEDDLLAARAEVIREIEGAADLRAHGGQPDHVRLALDAREVEVSHQLVGERDLVRRRREGLQVGQGDAARPVARRLVEGSVAQVVRRRDQVDAHRGARMMAAGAGGCQTRATAKVPGGRVSKAAATLNPEPGADGRWCTCAPNRAS